MPFVECSLSSLYFGIAFLLFWTSGVRSEVDRQVSEGDCSQGTLIGCAYPLKIEEFEIASKKEDLDELCSNLHKGLRCIDDYTRRCLPPPKRSHFNKLYTGTSIVIQEICQQGPYQDQFLRHAPCMKNVRKGYEVCARDYQEKIQNMNAKLNETEIEVEQVCCSLLDYLSCSKTTVKETCGEETGTFAAGFLDKMAFSVIEIHCGKVASLSEGCQMSSSSSLRYCWTCLTVPFLLITSFHMLNLT